MSDAAITNVVTGFVTCVTLIVGFLTLWVRLKYGDRKAAEAATAAALKVDAVENKLDANTKLTRSGAQAALDIQSKLNGGVTEAIRNAISPLRNELEDHIERYERRHDELREDLKQASLDRGEIPEHVRKVINGDITKAVTDTIVPLQELLNKHIERYEQRHEELQQEIRRLTEELREGK